MQRLEKHPITPPLMLDEVLSPVLLFLQVLRFLHRLRFSENSATNIPNAPRVPSDIFLPEMLVDVCLQYYIGRIEMSPYVQSSVQILFLYQGLQLADILGYQQLHQVRVDHRHWLNYFRLEAKRSQESGSCRSRIISGLIL